MPTVNFTARTVKSLKPRATRVEYFDATVPGLALRVTPNGVKTWSVLYRHRGRLRRLTLGSAKFISLAKARERARDELYAAGKGVNPASQKQTGSKVFAFALDRDVVTLSPAVRIPRPGQEQQRDRVLSEDELRSLWASFDALAPAMAAFYKLRLLTAQRGGEVSTMRWQDVDLEAGWWTIPSTASKNTLAHRVPLNTTACAILGALLASARKDAIYVVEAREEDVSRPKQRRPSRSRSFGDTTCGARRPR